MYLYLHKVQNNK